MGDHWKRRMCCAAAITWGCVGWYGWARLFHLICMNISCQEAKLQSEISALYEKHMLQLSPLPGRFCSGSRNPRSLLWLALVSSQRSVTSGSDLNNWHISPSSITTCFVFTAGRWHYWRKDEYDSFSNTVCIYWCFFFCSWHCCSWGCHWDLLGGCRIESASCCYFAPTQAVMDLLILIILVNQFSYTEKVLLWMPSGIYCNPCHPCAPLLLCGPCN